MIISNCQQIVYLNLSHGSIIMCSTFYDILWASGIPLAS